jgi:hypothetical protein
MSKTKLSYEEFDKQICEAFPNLYRMRNVDPQTTCMYWGFEISQGWHDIVWDLSEKLEALILQQPEGARESFYADQVKSKYAELHFYMSHGTDEMWKEISKAEDLSVVTCERCGKPGRQYGGGWVTTLCEECVK